MPNLQEQQRKNGSEDATSTSTSTSTSTATTTATTTTTTTTTATTVATNKPMRLHDRDEEYLLARRAAAEAVTIGRETLAQAVQQGEQLQHAESMVDETEYTLDKASRLLRGMTWSGWLANKFSKDVESPEYGCSNDNYNYNGNGNADGNYDATQRSILGPPRTYERIPERCQAAAQAVQNYHLNLQVLEQCENDEQTGTCRVICDDMHRQARIKITGVLTEVVTSGSGVGSGSGSGSGSGVGSGSSSSNENASGEESARTGDDVNNNNNNNNNNNDRSNNNDDEVESFAIQLQEEAQKLRQRQLILQQMHQKPRAVTHSSAGGDRALLFDEDRTATTTGRSRSPHNTHTLSVTDKVVLQQEEHLSTMARHLQELGSLAGNLNISLRQQSEILDSLETKNETLHFKTHATNRRTDRFLKDKSWGGGKRQRADFAHYASIRHTGSGRYLSISPHNNGSTLVLSNNNNNNNNNGLNERCIFGIFRKQRVLGLQNKFSRKWVGQNLLGQLVCSASTFQRREEWEADGVEGSSSSNSNGKDDKNKNKNKNKNHKTKNQNANEWTDTTLLLVSAGWGAGGYLLLDANLQPVLGGADMFTKKQAPTWCIQRFDPENP